MNAGIAALQESIWSHAGHEFNINSPKQLGEVLFDHLKLDPDAARTATGQYATSEDVLLKIQDRHPIVPLILEHRLCSKLKSTYVDKLPTNPWIHQPFEDYDSLRPHQLEAWIRKGSKG